VVPGSPLRGGTSTTRTRGRSGYPLVPAVPTEPVFLSIAEFIERANADPEFEWLVPELVPASGSLLLVGPPNAGKTFQLLVIAKTAAALGRPVFFVEEEGSRRGLGSRIQGMRIPLDAPISIAHCRGVKLEDKRTFEMLLRTMGEAKHPVLILDPLASFFVGNENETEEANAFVHRLRLLQRSNAGLLLVLAHHTSKAGARGEGAALLAARGSIVFSAWADAQLNLSGLKAPHGTVRFGLEVAKMREAEKGPALEVSIALGSGIVTMEEAQGADNQAQEVRQALRADPEASANDIYKLVGGNRKAVLRLVAELKNESRREAVTP
jgi:hypothetical protein